MRFCVIAAAKAGNDWVLHIGQMADDAPGMKLFKVAHEILPVLPVG
jgi:hypothetical protein